MLGFEEMILSTVAGVTNLVVQSLIGRQMRPKGIIGHLYSDEKHEPHLASTTNLLAQSLIYLRTHFLAIFDQSVEHIFSNERPA